MAQNTVGETRSSRLVVKVEKAPPTMAPSNDTNLRYINIIAPPKDPLSNSDNDMFIGVTTSLSGVLLLICVGVAWYRFCILRVKFAPELTPNEEFQLDPTRSVQEQASELPYNVSWEFPRSDVSFCRIIGMGRFGQVTK